MDVGSVEYAVIAFPGNHFKGEIVPAIQELVDNGIVRILDVAFVIKDPDGNVQSVELSGLPVEESANFATLDHEVNGLLSQDDLDQIGASLEPDSSAGLLVWENLWSARFAAAVAAADGLLIANEKIPASVVQAALDDAADTGTTSGQS